jgi:hypothetical protein
VNSRISWHGHIMGKLEQNIKMVLSVNLNGRKAEIKIGTSG